MLKLHRLLLAHDAVPTESLLLLLAIEERRQRDIYVRRVDRDSICARGDHGQSEEC